MAAAAETRLDASASLVVGTAELFGILTALCGGSPRQAADSAGFDLRSMTERADLPSLDFIRRLGQPLGMDAAGTLGAIVALEEGASDQGLDPFESLEQADLLDDASRIERLAERILERARTPCECRVAFAAMSRAAAARGDAALSARFADVALALESSAPADSDRVANRIALELLEAAGGERVLGVPWEAGALDWGSDPRSSAQAAAVSLRSCTTRESLPESLPESIDAAAVRRIRARSHDHAHAIDRLLETWKAWKASNGCIDPGVAAQAAKMRSESAIARRLRARLADLAAVLSRIIETGPDRGAGTSHRAISIAWVASIAGCAAGRVIASLSESARSEFVPVRHDATRLLAGAQMIIDDAIDDGCAEDRPADGSVAALEPSVGARPWPVREIRTFIAVRRARLVLMDWSLRHAAGELGEGSVDEADLAEVRAACVPFQAARRSAVLARVEAIVAATRWKITGSSLT